MYQPTQLLKWQANHVITHCKLTVNWQHWQVKCQITELSKLPSARTVKHVKSCQMSEVSKVAQTCWAGECCSPLSRRSTNDNFWPNLPSLYKLLAASPAHNVHVRFCELRHQRVIRAGDSGEAGFCRHAARKCEFDFVRIKCQDDPDIPDTRWNRFLWIVAIPTLQSGLIYVEY